MDNSAGSRCATARLRWRPLFQFFPQIFHTSSTVAFFKTLPDVQSALGKVLALVGDGSALELVTVSLAGPWGSLGPGGTGLKRSMLVSGCTQPLEAPKSPRG